MRVLRWVVFAAVLAVTALPAVAFANGGAYIVLDGTHFLPGEEVVAETYAAIPKARRGLLDRGPFYAWLLPQGAWLREGRPIPEGAIRLGTFTIEHERGQAFELRTTFVVPDVDSAYHSIAMCNDPCSISGFREPLTGEISVVATAREGDLLTQNSRLQSRVYTLRRIGHRAERQAEELEAELAQTRRDNAVLASLVDDLREPDAAPAPRTTPSGTERPLIDGGVAAIVAGGLVALAAALVVRRPRRSDNTVPDIA